ncbi:MAG: hypothetical protein CEE38_12845 [Planctomycetes bacterium B3_Pla]|nr:MAG: hypothetical protein CEE38_12845 [Planctomycetes bacterium B3_Pla]
MARRLTKEAIRKLLTKGLTGWKAGKLILQDSIESYFRRDSFLTEGDIAAIRNTRMEGADVRDYNMFMALCRGFHVGHMLGEWTCSDACLEIILLERPLRDAHKRRTVELFESFGPRVVTRQQYDDIVAAQREKKLELEYNLAWVIEDRFYAIAPPEAREEIEELCIDIESAQDFASAIPKKYTDIYQQAVKEIRRLHISGKLPAVYQKEDAKEAEPLLAKWKRGQLSARDTMKLVDLLYVTGQQLYECDELPEWRDYMDSYNQYVSADEDERFGHTYAVLEDCSAAWTDEQGYYKGPGKPSEWITRSTERLLGLVNDDDKPKKSIAKVGAALVDRLETAMLNIRLFLATKAILDAAAEAVELDIPAKVGMLAGPNIRLGAFVAIYNFRLEELNEERKSSKSGGTRLEKALRMLPPIDPEKLGPSPESLKQLKDNVLKDAQGHDWLRTTVLSLEYEGGFSFRDVVRED